MSYDKKPDVRQHDTVPGTISYPPSAEHLLDRISIPGFRLLEFIHSTDLCGRPAVDLPMRASGSLVRADAFV